MSGSQTTTFVSGRSLEHPRDALQRAAGAEAGDPVVEPLALEVLDDLRAVVCEWTSALASFSNWRQRNQPWASASSTAFGSMPVPFSDAGVSTTLAPRKRIILRRSMLKFSAIVTTSG